MQRLVMSVLLLAVAVAAWIASDRRDDDGGALGVATNDPAAVTPLLSARRVPEFLSAPEASASLEVGLLDVMSRSPELSCLIVQDGDKRLFEASPEVGLVPASNAKITTATAALLQLGEETTYTTEIRADVAPVDGVLAGNLYLIGGGDPLLMTDDYAASFEGPTPVHTDLEALADQVVDAGITQIQGGVIGVEGRYDAERAPAVWGDTYAGQVVSGPLSDLMVNGAFTSFPPQQTDDAPPPVPAGDPVVHAASLFDDLLEARGVVITSGSRNEALPEATVEVTSIESPLLSEVVRFMMTQSDNAAAELLVKEIGLSRLGEASTSQGTLAMIEVIGSAGIDVSSLFPTDGSGLATNNRLSCGAIIDLLELSGAGSALDQAMPVAGRDGTLRDRYPNSSPVRNRVRAKTGTLAGVTALSGWIDTIPGSTLSFAYIANAETIDDGLLALQTEMLERMLLYPIGPPIEELVPIPIGGDAPTPYRGSPDGGLAEGTAGPTPTPDAAGQAEPPVLSEDFDEEEPANDAEADDGLGPDE